MGTVRTVWGGFCIKLNAFKNDAKIWPTLDLYEICSTI